MSYIEKTSYGDLLLTQNDFNILAGRLGLNVHDNSRIPHAYKILDQLNRTLNDKEEFLKLKEKYDNSVLFSCIYDIGAIASVLPFLHEKDDILLKDKIKKVCSGSYYHTESQNDVIARNTLFELKMLALLRKSGFKAVLGDANPDVEFVFEENTYLIECKRPNGNNISDNIFDAVKQLEKKLAPDSRKQIFGVVAISLEYQFSPDKEVREVQTGDHMLLELSVYLKKIIKQYEPLWASGRRIKDKRILGIMFTVEAPFIAVSEVLLTTASYNILTNVVDSNCDDFKKIANWHSKLIR